MAIGGVYSISGDDADGSESKEYVGVGGEIVWWMERRAVEWRRGGKQVEEVGNDGGLWAMCVRYGGSIVSN